MSSGPVAPKGDGVLVEPRVSPSAKSAGLHGPHGEASLKPRVAAPPVDGRASAEVERFVTERTGAAPSKVGVVRGPSGREKTVFLGGVGAERVREVFRSRGR